VGHLEWSNFLVAEAGAAAALTGLIFVAVSINLAKILEYPGVAMRAGEAVLLLLGVLLVSSVALVPDQSDKTLGMELFVIGAGLWATVTTTHFRFRFGQVEYRWWWFATRVIFCQLGTVPFWFAGLSLIFGWRGAMYWLLPGCVFSLVAGVYSAWVLLIEIMR
jgi:modulator of FtsH protease